MCGVVKPLRVERGLVRLVYWYESGMDGAAMRIGDGWRDEREMAGHGLTWN